MKNHKIENGKLIQTNKKFSSLKLSQQEKIQNWLLDEYLAIVVMYNRLLTQEEKEVIVQRVYEKIKLAEIWIPYQEVTIYFSSKLTKWNQKYIV